MINVNLLAKTFDQIPAVKEITFKVNSGEIFGLLGPNGAGKSTTLNMLSGLVPIDQGQVQINGFDLSKDLQELKMNLGVVPQEISLYDEFTAVENLHFWGSLYKVPKQQLNENCKRLLSLIGLTDRQHDKVKTYSGGMKRRINIAAALMHNPKVLLLDEPTVGVDPQSRNRIFEIVETLNKEGMTIIYTSHYMEEVERLCDRIAIMDQGEIIAQGTQESLKENSSVKEVIELNCVSLSETHLNQLQQHIQLPFTVDGTTLKITGNSNDHLGEIIQIVNAAHIELNKVELTKVNLERVFLALTGKQLRD